MTGERLEQRKAGFKAKGLTTDELRRRREEASVEIRKVKREESLNKKRMGMGVGTGTLVGGPTDLSTFDMGSDDSDNESMKKTKEELQVKLPFITHQVYSDLMKVQLEGTTEFRRILSKEKNPPIDEVIQCNVIPRLIQFLNDPIGTADDMSPEDRQKLFESLQFEAAWALTNVASGNSQQTWTVVQHDGIPAFARLLNSSSKEVQEQAVWALGNIAGDSPTCRNLVIEAGILFPLLNILQQEMTRTPPKLSLLRNATWTLSNFCRGKPAPEWAKVSIALPVLNHLISCNDKEILADACWTLSYLSDSAAHIEAVIRSNVIPRLVQLLSYDSHAVQTPALRTIGNIVYGDDLQTQAVINAGALEGLLHLLSSSKASIVKEACWTISNITAGNVDQIQAVINANIIPPLISILQRAEFKTKKEACWAIYKATKRTNGKPHRPDQIRYLVSQGCIKPLCDLLSCHDNKTIKISLKALDFILEVGERDRFNNPDMVNEYAVYVEEAGGMDQINELQFHQNIKIYKKAKSLLDKYFSEEDTELDINAADVGINDSQAANGVNAQTGAFQFSSGTADQAVPRGGFKF